MELVGWTISIGFNKGILIGFRELEFKEEYVYERDLEIHLTVFKIVLTLIYN